MNPKNGKKGPHGIAVKVSLTSANSHADISGSLLLFCASNAFSGLIINLNSKSHYYYGLFFRLYAKMYCELDVPSDKVLVIIFLAYTDKLSCL